MKRAVMIGTGLIVLSACNPAAPPIETRVAASTPVLNRVNLDSPLRLTGTEPFWGADLGGGRLVLQAAGASDVALAATGPALSGGRAVWRAPATTVVLTAGPCSDGMSDRTYPLTAEVRSGGVVWKGCAANAAAFARAGGAGEVR